MPWLVPTARLGGACEQCDADGAYLPRSSTGMIACSSTAARWVSPKGVGRRGCLGLGVRGSQGRCG